MFRPWRLQHLKESTSSTEESMITLIPITGPSQSGPLSDRVSVLGAFASRLRGVLSPEIHLLNLLRLQQDLPYGLPDGFIPDEFDFAHRLALVVPRGVPAHEISGNHHKG